MDRCVSCLLFKQLYFTCNSSVYINKITYSYFFLTVLDKTKFHNTKYVVGGSAQRKLANHPRFKGSQAMGGDLYETKLGHQRIRIDLPMQVIVMLKLTVVCFDLV